MDALKKIRECATYVGHKMKQYQHVIGLILTLIMFLMRFIPIHNEVLKTRPANPPEQIISNGSKVLDLWTGNLLMRDVVIEQFEISLLLYYAPWSGESLDAMTEFEKAAEELHPHVAFIAINCWWIQGECRSQIKVLKYPQIYLHHKHWRQTILYRGPLLKEYFLHFIRKAIFPVNYLGSLSNVKNFLRVNQITVLASFRARELDSSKPFKNYSIIALRHLETVGSPVHFGVVTSDEISSAYFIKPNILQVRNRMNPRNVIHLNLKSSVEILLRKLDKVSSEIICPDLDFPMTRTNLLYQTINQGPTLIVFVSSDSIENREHYVSRIQNLAILYSACQNDSNQLPSVTYATFETKNLMCCKTVAFEDEDTLSVMCSICIKQTSSLTKLSFCDVVNNFIDDADYNPDSWIHTARRAVAEYPGATICASVLLGYDCRHGHYDMCCKEKELFFNDLKRKKEITNRDSWVEELLNKTGFVEMNETMISDTSGIDESLIFSNNTIDDNIVKGLGCRTNRSLQFLNLDFDRHQALSANLGLDKKVYYINGVKMGAVIFDPLHEKKYAMTSLQFHLENFIVNYTLGILPSHLRSGEDVSSQCIDNPCVVEITTETFSKEVLKSDKDVLLFYYTPWCISCMSVSHIFLSLADLLHPVPTVRLARINAQANDLPLPFTVQSYPTIVLFPAKKSSYSSVFPKDKEFSVSNLLGFLFNRTSQKSAKQILANLCASALEYPNIQHKACQKLKSLDGVP